ncbi:MAG: hypothetical protein A2Y17_12175 [Clostridiales bacterium GWF2_38_85]|nr:MAG: hypothetical protein A2Y17_12175 [Clostridiales bacterium GWF2_38_85]
MQALPFTTKVNKSITRIVEWIIYYEGQVYISFSGGKDSTVLLHLCRYVFPEIQGLFINTGLEYPENVEFALSIENVKEIKPRISYKKVIEEYGYPVPTKEIAHTVRWARKGSEWALNKLNGTKLGKDGKKSKYCCEKWKFLIDAPFKVSEECCKVMKKEPAYEFERQSGKKPIIGTTAEESGQRNSDWLTHGCNAFDNERPKSNPLSFWTEQDILRYIKEFNLPYSAAYGDIKQKESGEYYVTGAPRTGCMGCMFGVHLEPMPNRFQKMAVTHPKHYDAYINKLGEGEILDYIGVDYRPSSQLTLFNNEEEY